MEEVESQRGEGREMLGCRHSLGTNGITRSEEDRSREMRRGRSRRSGGVRNTAIEWGSVGLRRCFSVVAVVFLEVAGIAEVVGN